MDASVAAIVVKTILYLTCLTAGGGALFLSIFAGGMTVAERLDIARFTRGMAAAGLCATIVRVLILSAMLGDDWAAMWDWSLIQVILSGSEGQATAVRCGGLIAIAASAFQTRAVAQAVALLGAVAGIGSFALTGHAGSVGPGALPRVIVAIHLLGVSYWVGALVPLFRLAASSEYARFGRTLRRFGKIAVFAVSGLIAAGSVLLWLLLGSLAAITGSEYGQLVLSKLACVAGLLLLAAGNKIRLTPAVAAGDPAALALLRWSIAAEIAVVLAILAITASLTTIVGPPQME
jgi:copper resistance protein D